MELLSDLTSPITPMLGDSLSLSPDQGIRTTEILRNLFSIHSRNESCTELDRVKEFLKNGRMPVYHLRRLFSSVKTIQRWWRRTERRKKLKLAASVLQWGVQQEIALRKHREQIVKAKRIGLPTSRATSQFAVLSSSSPETMYEKAVMKWHDNVKRCRSHLRTWMTANGEEMKTLRKRIKRAKLQQLLFGIDEDAIQQLQDDEEEFDWLRSTMPQIEEVIVTQDMCNDSGSSSGFLTADTFPRLSQRRASLSADAGARHSVVNLRRCESDNVMSPLVFRSQSTQLGDRSLPAITTAFDTASTDSGSTPRRVGRSPRGTSPRGAILQQASRSPIRRSSTPLRGALRSPRRSLMSASPPPSPPPSPRPFMAVPDLKRRATTTT
eukprot:TRINITY_DN6564_c0_g1_i1.p1 TRINITY_DN6564_c0_g1~~TRINITY_DN6564_c0_g1_i1.p1  ORF type:complete len:381 (+),score=48.27 TRINITY_DN6564_c0_g1_i1:58-1200(+)